MSDRIREQLLEEDGPVVPGYALTKGRVLPSGKDIDLVAIVIAKPGPTPMNLGPEQWVILNSCMKATPLADIAAIIDLPLGVVRVLVGDLHEQGLITVRPPAEVGRMPSASLLTEVIHGLKAL